MLRSRHEAGVASGARPFIDHPPDHTALPQTACWTPLALDAPLLRVDTAGRDPLPAVLEWLGALG